MEPFVGSGLIVKTLDPLRELIVRNIPELERAAAKAATELLEKPNDQLTRTRVMILYARACILRELLEVAEAAPTSQPCQPPDLPPSPACPPPPAV